MKKFFVVSLPRTGTKSLCKMAKICGLDYKHVPGIEYKKYIDSKTFFADTPCYVPSFIEMICQDNTIESNFIYIEKDYNEIFSSWNKVGLFWNYSYMYSNYLNEETRKNMSKTMIYDIESYNEIFSHTELTKENYFDLFSEHKNKILNIIKTYNKNILFYKFSDGWNLFCDFVGCEVPKTEIPHININTMFEPI